MFDILNTKGYGRMSTSMVMMFVIVSIVLTYQFFAYREPSGKMITNNTVGYSAIQLFPQSLPVHSDLKYVFTVLDDENKSYDLGRFLHKTEDVIVTEFGQVIEEGLFDLPPDIGGIISAQIIIYEGSDPEHPFLIPFLKGAIDKDRSLLQFASVDFSTAAGKYMLSTPTDNNSLVNERSGLWFGDVIKNDPALSLPQLPRGWIYEGWVLIDGQTLTAGKFKSTVSADAFSGFSDDKGLIPNFPGEDFLSDPPVLVFPDLKFPVDLVGQSVMITIEPDNNNVDPGGAAPFPATILQSNIPKLAESGKLYDLDLVIDQMPKATVVLR